MNSGKGKFLAKYKTTLLSTGVSTLDSLLNGGLATGTITLLEEDHMNVHCSVLCQYFVSCGLSNSQDTALVTDEVTPEMYFDNLPKIVTTRSVAQDISQLNIAWRYKNLAPTQYCDNFDDKNSESINILNYASHYINKLSLSENLKDALAFISKFLKEKFRPRNPLRLVITSLGSPLWGCYEDESQSIRDIFRFLFCLKQLVSDYSAVAVVSINPNLFDCMETTDKFRSIAHYVFKFEAFDDPKSVGEQLHNDISGQIRPIKIPCVNSVEPIFRPNTLIWSYHVRRKKIIVKEFSLPPCLSDNTSRSNQNEASKMINKPMGCGSGLDF